MTDNKPVSSKFTQWWKYGEVIAVGVKNFRGLSNAQKCAQRLRRRRNLVEDDVQVFQSSIRS